MKMNMGGLNEYPVLMEKRRFFGIPFDEADEIARASIDYILKFIGHTESMG